MKQIIICGIIGALVLSAFLPPHSFVVKGRITDRSGTPLSGVSVTEKGTANITQTNARGYFSIRVTNADAVLICSSIGFSTMEMSVSGKSTINVQMIPEEDFIDQTADVNREQHKTEDKRLVEPRAAADEVLRGRVAGLMKTENASPSFSAKRRIGVQNNRYNPYGNPGWNTEDYDAILENSFLSVAHNPLSTFSIDVDAAAYSNVRRYLNNGQLPPAGAVRTEELINYFHYNYPKPDNGTPFAIYTEISDAPWNAAHRLVLVSLQGKKIATDDIPASNLVFLIDVSGSMEEPNKLPLVRQSMKLLTDQLREQDKVSIVVYAGSAGLVLPPTSGANKQTIKDAIDRLTAGGSTAGGAGIKLAYQVAQQNFVGGGNNRVILCTDGDFNVGVSSDAEMESLIEKERKSGVFLTVLGYGTGNYKDNKMQKLANKGNGTHAYIDDMSEAKKVLVSEFGGTLFTIAKDVKLQVEFNPSKVQAYRLIGYENRLLKSEDFNNDQKDAGELGSGHTVTALYEVIPTGIKSDFIETVDALKYQSSKDITPGNPSPELMTVKARYKDPDGSKSKLIQHPVIDVHTALAQTSANFRFAASVAQFGMLLTHSGFMQQSSYNNVLALANTALSNDPEGYRKGFLDLVKKAAMLAKQQLQNGEANELTGSR